MFRLNPMFVMDLHWKDVDGNTTYFEEIQRRIGGQCQRREKLSLSQQCEPPIGPNGIPNLHKCMSQTFLALQAPPFYSFKGRRWCKVIEDLYNLMWISLLTCWL